MLSVIMQNVIMLNVVMLNIVVLNVILLNVVKLNVIMLSVVMLNVVMLNVIMLSVVTPSGPMKLECFISQGRSGLQGINTLAYWTHFEENKLFWKRRQFREVGLFQQGGTAVSDVTQPGTNSIKLIHSYDLWIGLISQGAVANIIKLF
jgi:hypothetical protein